MERNRPSTAGNAAAVGQLHVPRPDQLPPYRRPQRTAPQVAYADVYLDLMQVEDHMVWAFALSTPTRANDVRSGSAAGQISEGIESALAAAQDLVPDLPLRISSPHPRVASAKASQGLVVYPPDCAWAHPLRAEVKQVLADEANTYLAQAPRLVVATDGSWSRGRRSAGWGYVAADGRSGCGQLTRTASPLVAELAAIRAVLSHIPAPRRLRILTDSRHSIALVTGAGRGPVAVRNTVPELRSRLECRDVELTWVKGHQGPGLHDGADRLAVAARRALDAGLGNKPHRDVADNIVAEALAAHSGGRTRRDFGTAA